MKTILLVSNKVYHYRISNYNYFYDAFRKLGFEFVVLTYKAQKVDFDIHFRLIVKKQLPGVFIRAIKEINPDVVITFLHLKDIVLFPINFFCKLRKICIIYWNFGIDLVAPNALLKNMLYHFIHNIVDAIILYSPNEIKYIKKHNRHKVFIANNTLNFADIRRESYNAKHHLRDHYGVKENFSVLFAGRINRYKKIHLLLEIFRDHEDIAVVIVGNGMKSKERLIIERVSNYYWLGEIYNRDEMARIFSSADVFCIPGNLGLGMNEAFFWGKPVLTIKDPVTINSPEIWYLEDGVNGFEAENIRDLENKIILLKSNREIYRNMSVSAMKTADNKAHISQMFKGFKDAVEFVLHESSLHRSEFNNLFFQ